MSWKASGAAKDIACGAHGEELNMADKLVLMVLSDDFNEDKQYAYPSQDLLAKRCLCTPRGLRGILDRLERFGLIKIVHRGKAGNYYVLLFALRNALPQSFEEQAGASKVEVYEERDAVYEERAGSQELDLEQETPKPEQETPCRVCGETGVHTCRRPVLKQGRDRRPKYPKRTEEFPSSQYREPVSVAAPVWDPHGFSAFWQAYPLKMSQDRAFEAWNEMRPPIEEVLANLARWKASSRWRKDGGEYIPYPRKFLLEKLWKSNPEPEIERALTAREEREKRNAETIARVRAKDTHPKAAGRVRELLQARSD